MKTDMQWKPSAIPALAEKALRMAEDHDFDHALSDDSRTAGLRARDHMRSFVALAASLPDPLRDALRDFWGARCSWSRCYAPGYTSPQAPLLRRLRDEARERCLSLIRQYSQDTPQEQ